MKRISPYAEGQTQICFRWLHLRHETGRYWYVAGAMPHWQWYWDRELFCDDCWCLPGNDDGVIVHRALGEKERKE